MGNGSEMETNPYESPLTSANAEFTSPPSGGALAGRFTRFAAAMADGFLLLAILMPIQFATGYFARAMVQQVGIIEQIVMSLLGLGIMLLLNGYLLVNRGQTIGKMLTKIQIVDAETSKLLSFVRVYVYRYLWTLPFVLGVILIPGSRDDVLVNVVIFIDVVIIFGAARRCIHDYIAGSKVVLYQPGRERLV